MAEKSRTLELAIRALKREAQEIQGEMELLEQELALSLKQAGQGTARLVKGAARAFGEAVAPEPAPKRKRRRRR
jgi:hypothetical protein